MKALLRKIRQILRDRRTRRFLTRFVSGVAAIVVFVTTYALVLPAITMENEAACGIEAHQHDDSCYSEELICGQEESEGHHHTEDCYTVTKELECQIQEHQHSLENGCFDEEGNLVCEQEEHTHSDSCYKEHRELTCGLEESEGHHHTDSCYEKVLTCGKEVHTHSAACYKTDLKIESAAVASTGVTSAAAVPDLSDEDIYSEEPEHSQDDPAANEALDEQDQTDEDEEHTDKERADEDAENGDAYIPEKEELDFNTVLNSRTGIYYHHVAEDEEIEDSSAISDWDKADEDTELNRADLIRMYLSYTLPRDTVNATNDIARYRLPDSLHLTDEQVDAINECENGISSQYIEYDSLEITDVEHHTAYLGLESVEGTRRPGEEPEEDDQEYISATVKAEKIYDEETGEYEGTDLIFTFSPYTVEKNAHAYDKKGQPTRAGEEVTGWLTLDFNMGQIDWAEDNTSEIIFAEEDRENKVSEISTVLKQADPSQAEDDDLAAAGMTEAAAEDMTADEDAADAATETAAADETAETAAQDATEEAAAADVTTEETAAADNTVDKAEEAGTEKTAAEAPDDEKDKKEESVAAGYPAAVFDDSITVRSGRLDSDLDDTDIPKKTKMTVHVEADEGTFPEGTRMVLSAVEDLDAVAEAVGTAIDAKTRGFQAVDITFYDKDPSEEDAKEIEPLKPMRVSIKSDEIKKAAEDSSTAPVVVHIEDNNTATEVESTASKTDSASIEIEKPGVEGEMTAPDNDSANNEDESKDAANKAGDNKNSENKAAEDKDREDAANEDAADESTEGVTGKNDAGEETDPAADDSTEGVTGTNDAGEETDSAADESTEGVTGKNDAGEETDPAADDSSEGVTGTVDAAAGDAVSFEAGSFSIYAVVYTVDFHWEVDGKLYDFSIPGGGFVSLEHLVEALGIGTSDKESTSEHETAANIEEAAETEDHPAPCDEAIKLNEVKISDTTRKFMADVERVEFPVPELVWVGKADSDSTVGRLKEANELKVEYSAELTEKEIGMINAQTVKAGDWALISLQPFTSEEALTVTMKDGETFTIRVTDAQIKKTVIDAKGDTWVITVTYGEDAKIPNGAELKVREILSTDEEYESLCNSAATEACSDAGEQGIDMPILSGARLFDIEIQSEEGKVEPSAPVQVSIRLLGTAPADHTSVVHFEEDGARVLTAQKYEIQMPETRKSNVEAPVEAADETQGSAENRSNETDATELSFQTDSFSVYSVVNVTNMSSLVGSDKKFALVSGIAHDPGATTGYSETWGRDYFTLIVNAHALSDQYVYDNQNRVDGLRVEPVHAYEDGSISYIGGNPAQWQFESAGNGKYYLCVDGKYLQRFNKGENNNYGWEARLVENRNNATQLSITVNSDGTILIYDDLGGQGQQYYLHNEGPSQGSEFNSRIFKFTNQNVNTNSAAYRFRVCEESDQFESFAARKVSVQNLTVNDSFLIYHKFEDSQGNEQLFALASDGTFVRVYDGGDSVYWRETDKNIYWNYRLEGNYYTIYSTLPGTGEPVYINPMYSSDPKQTITSTPSGLTLIGKDNGEYGTAIENWDQTAYDYAGLHVTVNAQGEASLSAGTRVGETSDVFLFAVASSMPGETAETVDTVDSDSLGIKITMFDYGRAKGSYSAGDKLSEMTAVAGSAEYTPHAAHQLVKAYLENGLPSSKTNGAMEGLFTEGGSAVTAYKENVNHLFLQSYYDENGMFRYRSEDNYAYLSYDPDTEKITGTDFTVYRQAATPYPYDSQPGHSYYTHGHFMPFNDIDMTQNVSRLMNQYGNMYDTAHPNDIIGELPIGDGRTYEDIYATQGIPNFYTGMKMEANFTQLKDGKLENGDPMVFKFTGDDDMWVYIDGVLVLDIGGIHEPLSGTIDFSTGKVSNPSGSSLAGEKTLYDIFMAVKEANGTPQGVKDKIDSITWKDVDGDGTPDTFADYTNHDFKAFYMERGAGASNLDIQFNLKVMHPDEFVVTKQIPDGVDPRFVNQEYKFQATFKDYTNNDEIKPLFVGQKYGTQQEIIACTSIVYKDRKDENGNPVPVNVDNNGYFTLKAGEAAVFKMADKELQYTVKEVEIDSSEKTEKVEINGQVVTIASGTAEAAYARVQDRSQLNYRNHPFLQNLNIIKHLLPEGTQDGPGDVFEFRVYLESTVEVEGQLMQQLVPYSYGPYYVTKIVDGQTHYYTLTGTNNAPVDKGTTPVVCSTTGRSGSINSIPPEFTVEIRNLAVGTHFYVEERRDNIPSGFVFDHEDLIAGTYDEQTLGTDDEIISRIIARDEKDHQSFDPDTVGKIKKGVDAKSEVFNKKVSVNVRKQWLKMNGQPYTLKQARQLPGSQSAVITAELWKKKIAEETSGETDNPVTVTFMVNTTADTEYSQVSVPVTIKNGSTLEFSLGARGTSQAKEIHSEPEYNISRSSVTSNPKIHYSNGRQKDKWSKYTISGITEDTKVYATFDADKVGDDFVGLYIASKVDPGSSETPVEEKVADITLNDANDWLQKIPKESGYTYFLMNVVETGLEGHAHEYTFIDSPTVTTDADGNLILAVANKYREPINVTVEKVWSPALTSEEESDAHVIVELHRYAKKTKGLLEVVLKDNFGAPIEGAVFKLYKDDVEQEQTYTTDVNGKIAAGNLEPGTYRFKQISTPEGYSMSDSAPQTEDFVVKDDQTVPQQMHCELQNQALETNGVATLTLLDNNDAPIQGAKYELRRKGTEEIIKQGLVTDAEGKITVSQLKAGTYYFFETEPPADYNLPNEWQDTEFTVLEHPGIVQTFNISMVNNLKGKGYVEITLTGPDGQPVSNATFELYKGSEKLTEGTTGNDGKLTFGNPERLAAGTYVVKQISTDANLLPANQQSFTIQDNGNANQKNELTFSNSYRGMGTATVTLTRKDNNNPISGAKFELYKDSEYFMEKTTDENGQLVFGSPDKLPVGNYSIKQISTVDGLDPIVNNWPFEILENGNPNQTYSWNVQNEENAGNVTIKLWKKGGFGQWNWSCLNTYTDLRPGRTYSFTAQINQGFNIEHLWCYQDESDHINADSISNGQVTNLNPAGWDAYTYHFTITPTKDNSVYSYVLLTDWDAGNIKSMTMDESSRQAAAPASGRSQSQQVKKLAVSKNGTPGSVQDSAQMAQGVQNNTSTPDSGSKKSSSESSKGSALRDVPQVVSPSSPPSDDYIVDANFTKTYTITKEDNNWKHVFENLDKYDNDENPYYYYVVETECVPDSYHVTSYTNDNLTETGTITITNQRELKGSLSVTKQTNGLDPADASGKTYQIGVKDVSGNYYTLNGELSGTSPYYVTFNANDTKTWVELPKGSYTVEEADAAVSGYTWSVTGTGSISVLDGGSASATVINTYTKKYVNLDILKVQKDTETPLENATFKLWKIDGESSSISKDSTTEQTVTTNAQGKASFINLTVGYYIITETNTPAGYVITGDDSFYIEITDSGISLLTKGEGTPSTWPKNAASYGIVKTFTAATADSNAQATIENEPGAALPNTGGPGTWLFTILGSILILGSGVLLWRRRRLI